MVKNLNTVDRGTSIRVGAESGGKNQGTGAVAIGISAASVNQGTGAVAIGVVAGNSGQEAYSVAIGSTAGNSGQKAYSVAIGSAAGLTSQNNNAVAIGNSAGLTNQGENSIAIGAYSNAKDKSIVMNATGTDFHPSRTDGFFVKPVRDVNGGNGTILEYTIDGEIINTQIPVAGITEEIDVERQERIDVDNYLQAQISSLNLQDVTDNGKTTTNEITIDNNLIVTGNLQVNGTETIVNTEKLLVEDPIIELANNLVDPNCWPVL